MAKSNRGMQVLALLYVAEGVLFLAFSLWRLVINPLQFYRAPPALEYMANIFMFLMFAAGAFFVYQALNLLKGWVKAGSSDLIASVLSMPLWGLPALIAMGNANTYLTAPYIPAELRPTGFYYLQVGIFFIVIGIINLISLLLSIYLIVARTRLHTRATFR